MEPPKASATQTERPCPDVRWFCDHCFLVCCVRGLTGLSWDEWGRWVAPILDLVETLTSDICREIAKSAVWTTVGAFGGLRS